MEVQKFKQEKSIADGESESESSREQKGEKVGGGVELSKGKRRQLKDRWETVQRKYK
jgi:hypothetical protein